MPTPVTAPPEPPNLLLDTDRRTWLTDSLRQAAACVALGLSPVAFGSPRVPPRADSPPVGIDPLVMRTGLSGRWAQAMRQDMGWKADWQTHDSLSLLRQLEDGQLPMAVFLGGAQADALDRSGLIHDRRTLAFTDVLLIGPQDDQAGLRGESDWRRAITQVLTARIAGAARWEPPPGGHALGPWVDQWSQGFTRQGALSRPAPPVSAPPGLAYSVTTRAAWQAAPDRDRRIWLSTSGMQGLPLQVARSFRASHPGAALLVKWLDGPLSRRQIRALAPGWRLPGA